MRKEKAVWICGNNGRRKHLYTVVYKGKAFIDRPEGRQELSANEVRSIKAYILALTKPNVKCLFDIDTEGDE